MAAILDDWRGDAAPRPAARPSQPAPPSPRRGIDPRNELRQCSIAELQDLVKVARDQALIATARVTMYPPQGAPMVGRYPIHPDKVHPVASIGPDLVDDIGGVWGLERMLAAYERWKSGVGGDEIDEDDAAFDVYFEEGWRPDRSRKEPR
jgi:hypothetical protein